MIPSDVQEAQVEAIVGNVKNGRLLSCDYTLQVSIAFPPPHAKIISASITS